MTGEVGDDQHLIAQVTAREDRSTSEKTRAISSATLRRNRSVCTKSTAERNRDWRKTLGHASGTWAFNSSTRRLRVSSSKAAPASANKIKVERVVGPVGDGHFDGNHAELS